MRIRLQPYFTLINKFQSNLITININNLKAVI